MISILKITKGNKSAKKIGGVTIVNLCMSSGHACFILVPSFVKLSRTISKLWSG